MTTIHENFLWFKENYDKLFEEYGACYLVIKDKKVIAHYKSYSDAVHKTEKTEAPGTFNVQYCDGTPEAYRVRVFNRLSPVVHGG